MLHISQPVETAPPSARAVAASTGMAAQLSTKQPETPQDQAYSQDDCMSDRLGSCSGASSSSAFQSAQKKRKVPGPATGWTKHRDDKLCSSSGPSSCGSSAASSVDCLLSWSQSYAASRGGAYIARSSFQNASAAVPGRQAPCGLLCQEEIVDEEAHPCSTSFSEMSSGSSASMLMLQPASKGWLQWAFTENHCKSGISCLTEHLIGAALQSGSAKASPFCCGCLCTIDSAMSCVNALLPCQKRC